MEVSTLKQMSSLHIYEQVFEMLRKGGVVMPVIFGVGWLA